jgi:Asp-tRNA(Asn)/Glu-tRNA(Gln) amidotransferase A subunit family amidase
MDELLCSSASGMARAIREKKISSAELMQAHLERIEAVNPRLNAIVQLPAERVMAGARAADAAHPWHEDVALAIARLLEEAFGGWQAPPL